MPKLIAVPKKYVEVTSERTPTTYTRGIYHGYFSGRQQIYPYLSDRTKVVRMKVNVKDHIKLKKGQIISRIGANMPIPSKIIIKSRRYRK